MQSTTTCQLLPQCLGCEVALHVKKAEHLEAIWESPKIGGPNIVP